MRSFAFLAAPLLASVALAQDDSQHTTVLTIGFTNSAGEAVTATTTYVYQYSNPATTLLTQTNSDGIITGLPSEAETSQPAVVTSQPAVVTSIPGVATIPAGLPAGTTTITQGNSSFVISVGPSTTVVLTSATSTSTSEDASSTGESGDSTPTDGSSPSSTSGSSDDSPTETPGAASGVVPASFGFVSLVALVAALF